MLINRSKKYPYRYKQIYAFILHRLCISVKSSTYVLGKYKKMSIKATPKNIITIHNFLF